MYVVMRAFRPELVIETGVGHGISSIAILAALERNEVGELFSIDAPNLDPFFKLPVGKGPGWIVPERLKSRWHMQLGRSRDILPQILARLPQIDIFIHDSEHSYENMAFELETAYPRLRPGGLLISDDTNWNSAFAEFVLKVGCERPSVIRHPNIRAIRKEVS